MSRRHRDSRTRGELLAALVEVGREHSDATVLWHTTIAESVGMHPSDYKTLSLLQRRGPLPAGAIGEATGLASGSVTALIDRLVHRRFARRMDDPADGRRVLVQATPEATKTFGPYFASPELSQDRMYEPFSVTQLETILEFLTRSTERLRRAQSQLVGR